MKIHTALTVKEYLRSLSDSMGSIFNFGTERFTGFTMGRWFYVTHHAGYEWNRRITNEKNAALGYVEETPEGCHARFICFKGMLCPGQFLLGCLLTGIIAFFAFIVLSDGTDEAATIIFGCCAAALVLGALFDALFESLTGRSEEGRKRLMALLIDPSDPFTYLNHRNEL